MIVRRTPDGQIADVLPAPFSARTTANEYGGGAFLAANGIVYFSNYADQRIWRFKPGAAPEPLTSEGQLRFADCVLDATRNRLIGVAEDHSAGDAEPANRIVAIDLTTGAVESLVEGADFYSTPCVSPDGRQLAWLAWNHPNMPWDGTELSVAQFQADGSLGESRLVAGGKDESIFQGAWAPEGTLYFVSDRSDWWNLCAERDGKILPVLPMNAEFGAPQWVFGTVTYGFLADGRIVARYTQDGAWRLAVIEPQSGKYRDLDLPYTSVANLAVGRERAVAIVGSPTVPESVVEFDPATGNTIVLRVSSPTAVDPAYTSIPQAVEFPTTSVGKQGVRWTAHAFYYPPTNRDFRGPVGELPPLLVMIHGGPTSATSGSLRLSIQYWTSRGFAVCDVNYGGSTGYGRAYRNRLRENWGVVDVADATNAAPLSGRPGKGRPHEAADPRRERGRLHDARLAGVWRRVPRGSKPVRRERFESLGRGHAQIRVAVSRPARGALSRGKGAVPGPLAGGPPGRLHRAGDPAARPGGQGRAAEPGGDDPRVAQVPRHPGGVRALRGRTARLSAGGEYHPRPRSGAVFLFEDPGIPALRRDRGGGDIQLAVTAQA